MHFVDASIAIITFVLYFLMHIKYNMSLGYIHQDDGLPSNDKYHLFCVK